MKWFQRCGSKIGSRGKGDSFEPRKFQLVRRQFSRGWLPSSRTAVKICHNRTCCTKVLGSGELVCGNSCAVVRRLLLNVEIWLCKHIKINAFGVFDLLIETKQENSVDLLVPVVQHSHCLFVLTCALSTPYPRLLLKCGAFLRRHSKPRRVNCVCRTALRVGSGVKLCFLEVDLFESRSTQNVFSAARLISKVFPVRQLLFMLTTNFAASAA